MLNLKTHVLRFWETEFPQLESLRTESGQRLYTDENVAVLRRIQQLLHEQGMTIRGAKRILAGGAMEESEQVAKNACAEFLQEITQELDAICQILKRSDQQA